MARSKLQPPTGTRDSVSLHRWVLLKNSIIAAPDDSDTFMFPDVADQPAPDVSTSEAQWLDSLLQSLGDDEDDDDIISESNISLPAEDDDDDLISPVASPISSSDDLTHSACFPHNITVSYLYPHFHPPLIYPYEFHTPVPSFDSHFSSDEPLPYYDLESLSVPDAIEDTSDDESDTPTTPSIGRSSLLEPPAVPGEQSRLRYANPHVHLEPDDPYFYPFELDPLPFPNEHQPYNTYQEC
ncbi:hypothetical protein H0H92_011501 [Tricholoma furcatifolium]|nr:hypothetical protein H0H92_011501 [Tricholoma furcatifolium]